jgi:hypothetical protein
MGVVAKRGEGTLSSTAGDMWNVLLRLTVQRLPGTSGTEDEMIERLPLCAQRGLGWKRIASELGVGVGTLYRFAGDGSKIQEKAF